MCCVHECTYVCACMYVCVVCMHVCVCAHVWVHMGVYVCVHVCMGLACPQVFVSERAYRHTHICVCVCMRICTHTNTGVQRPEKVLDALEAELQVTVTYWRWVQGTELLSSEEQKSPLNWSAIALTTPFHSCYSSDFQSPFFFPRAELKQNVSPASVYKVFTHPLLPRVIIIDTEL